MWYWRKLSKKYFIQSTCCSLNWVSHLTKSDWVIADKKKKKFPAMWCGLLNAHHPPHNTAMLNMAEQFGMAQNLALWPCERYKYCNSYSIGGRHWDHLHNRSITKWLTRYATIVTQIWIWMSCLRSNEPSPVTPYWTRKQVTIVAYPAVK
jgi:hypothetical protein